MGSDLPEHVEIKIDPNKIEYFSFYLEQSGYYNTLFQVVKPYQMFGLVKQIEFDGKIVEHHVRAFEDGTITTEIELRRIDDMWLHLTSKSRSAHEMVLTQLERLSISYSIDQGLRRYYNEHVYEGFPRDYMEFFRWLFIGVLVQTPLGYLWKMTRKIKRIFVLSTLNLSKDKASASQTTDYRKN